MSAKTPSEGLHLTDSHASTRNPPLEDPSHLVSRSSSREARWEIPYVSSRKSSAFTAFLITGYDLAPESAELSPMSRLNVLSERLNGPADGFEVFLVLGESACILPVDIVCHPIVLGESVARDEVGMGVDKLMSMEGEWKVRVGSGAGGKRGTAPEVGMKAF